MLGINGEQDTPAGKPPQDGGSSMQDGQVREGQAPEVRSRAAVLYAEHLRGIHQRTDRLFAVLLSVEWVAGMAAALWVTPRTWAGPTSQTHPHVWAALLLGGAVCLPGVLLCLWRPGQALTRHVVALCQMLTGALLIHLTGGRIETHFHVFGSLAFLAFYRDWRVLVTASAVVVFDHLGRGLFWPESVFGSAVVSNWRWLEHAGWVLFEDAFLVLSCRQGVLEMHAIAERQAQLEATRERIELTVRERTAQLVEQTEKLGRTTEQLRASEARTQAVIEAAADGIVTLDASDRICSCNHAAGRLFGYAPDELANIPLSLLLAVPGSFRGEGDAPVHAEAQGRRRDGGTFPMELSVSAVRDGEGRRWIGILRDVSESKKAQAELQAAKEAAEAASRAKSEFLANMSHEIRTPMNGVLGMTELALGTELTEVQREYLTTIKTSADCLLGVINDILDFSKIEAGKLDLESIPFRPREAVAEALRRVAVHAQEKGLELAFAIAPDVPETLLGDPGRVQQVLVNLVGNATKFTEDGEVVVTVARASSGNGTGEDCLLRFSVRDTGIGIPRDKQKVIFEAFAQADGSMTRKYGGTGLGLAISANLVGLMGGRIWVESEPGRGSTFHFTVRFGVAAGACSSPVPADLAELRELPVLVVDDNLTNRRILQDVLLQWGMQPTPAEGGRVALAVLRRAAAAGQRFPLVLLDGHMPEMDGFRLAEEIRATPELAGATIMMLTSGGQGTDVGRCRELGIAGYLIKPIAQSALLAAIRKALGKTPADAPRAPSAALSSPVRPLHILLAEDNVINQQVAIHTLTREGHTVVTAGNGREALARLSRERFDVVLMDVQMPEMDGFEATALIRAREADTGRRMPVIALTAHAMKGDRERCLAAGMDGYVSKPIRTEELRLALAEVLPATAVGGTTANRADREEEVMDEEAVLARLGGDREFLRQLVGLFLADTPPILAEVAAALAEPSAPRVRFAAHKLKGIAAQFNATAVVACAQEVELAAAAGDLAAAAEAHGRLLPAIERLRQRLADLTADPPGPSPRYAGTCPNGARGMEEVIG